MKRRPSRAGHTPEAEPTSTAAGETCRVPLQLAGWRCRAEGAGMARRAGAASGPRRQRPCLGSHTGRLSRAERPAAPQSAISIPRTCCVISGRARGSASLSHSQSDLQSPLHSPRGPGTCSTKHLPAPRPLLPPGAAKDQASLPAHKPSGMRGKGSDIAPESLRFPH